MKKKMPLRLGATLVSVSFAMLGLNGKTVGNVFAAFESEAESTYIDQENVEEQTFLEEANALENVETTEAVVLSEETEIPTEIVTVGATEENRESVENTSSIPVEDSVPSTEIVPSTEVAPSTEAASLEESTQVTESISSSEQENESSTEERTEEKNEEEIVIESKNEEAVLTSVTLDLDQDLETVPIAFLNYLSGFDVYSLILSYSDGSKVLLNKEDARYTISVDYTDDSSAEAIVRRTYHVTLKENATGSVFEDTQSVEFGKKDPAIIKTEEMTTVIVEGKKWVMVQSTPSITGRYSMDSNKMIESMYYASDDGEVIQAEETFRLQQGDTYKFLIKLK